MPEEAPKMDRVGRLNLKEVPYLSTFSPKGLDKASKLERTPCLSTFSNKHYKNLPFLFYSWKIPTIPRFFSRYRTNPGHSSNQEHKEIYA